MPFLKTSAAMVGIIAAGLIVTSQPGSGQHTDKNPPKVQEQHSTPTPHHVTPTNPPPKTSGSGQAAGGTVHGGTSTYTPKSVVPGTHTGTGTTGSTYTKGSSGAGSGVVKPSYYPKVGSGTGTGTGTSKGTNYPKVGSGSGTGAATGTNFPKGGTSVKGSNYPKVGPGSGTGTYKGSGSINAGTNVPHPPFHPPAGATTQARVGGGNVYTHTDGRRWETDRSGRVTSFQGHNVQANFNQNGSVRTARFVRSDRSTLVVNRTVYSRTVEVVHENHVRYVSYGRSYGFVERPMYGRVGFIQRTYIYGGRPYAFAYRTGFWAGVAFSVFVAPTYYAPPFYGWCYNPWRAPIVFGWGWRADPWYAYYGGYFVPAPVYPTASLWLTDYLLAENLRLAYEARRAAAESQGQPVADQPPPQDAQQVTLSPEVKQAIAEEVRRQIAEQQASAASQPQAQPSSNNPPAENPASSAPPPALDPKQRLFVVSSSLDVAAGNLTCSLTPGDIIYRIGSTPDANNKLGVNVISSKSGDCPVDTQASIELVALQEMHNQFRQQIAAGMDTLASNQGRNGLPTGPAAGARPSPNGSAQVDPNAASVLAKQVDDANQAEAQLRQQASTSNN